MGKRVSGNILVERKICRKNENGHVCHFHSMSLLCWHFSNHFCLVFCTIACVRARCVPITKGSPHWRICFCATISRTISTIRPISWSQKQRFRRVLQTMNGHDTCSILVNMCIADYINIWFHSAYKVIFVFTCTLYARKGNLNHLQFGWSNKLVGFCLQHFVQTFVDTRVFLYNFQCFGTSKLVSCWARFCWTAAMLLCTFTSAPSLRVLCSILKTRISAVLSRLSVVPVKWLTSLSDTLIALVTYLQRSFEYQKRRWKYVRYPLDVDCWNFVLLSCLNVKMCWCV